MESNGVNKGIRELERRVSIVEVENKDFSIAITKLSTAFDNLASKIEKSTDKKWYIIGGISLGLLMYIIPKILDRIF